MTGQSSAQTTRALLGAPLRASCRILATDYSSSEPSEHEVTSVPAGGGCEGIDIMPVLENVDSAHLSPTSH